MGTGCKMDNITDKIKYFVSPQTLQMAQTAILSFSSAFFTSSVQP